MKSDIDRSPLLMRRVRGGLSPVTAWDAERLDAYAEGHDIEVTVRQRRSSEQNRFYWVTLANVVAATGDFPTAEHLHAALKYALGYHELMKRWDGTIEKIPDSTAFAKMDAAAFKVYMDKAFLLIRERYGIDPETIGREYAAA